MFADWILKVYDKCHTDCITPPDLKLMNQDKLSEIEKTCATNCIRKYDSSYKLYCKVEDTIFTSYMETTDIDPEEFFAKANNMSKD